MSSASDKKSTYIFANCITCQGIIRIPITIRPDSLVSCPHCKSQFELYEFFDQIPEVGIEEGAVETSEEFEIETDSAIEKQDGKYIVPPQLAAGIRRRRRRRKSRRSVAQPDTADSNRQLSEAEENLNLRREERAKREREKHAQQREGAPPHKGTRPRRVRKKAPKRSPAMEAFKIIVGGMLAAPIAYLLLMWLFSRDPLGIVPTINDYAPVLVPDAMVLEEPQPEPISVTGNNSTESDEAPSEDELDPILPIPKTDPDDVDREMIDLDS